MLFVFGGMAAAKRELHRATKVNFFLSFIARARSSAGGAGLSIARVMGLNLPRSPPQRRPHSVSSIDDASRSLISLREPVPGAFRAVSKPESADGGNIGHGLSPR